MPLLPLEPFLFPDDLLVKENEPHEGTARWWVLHTRPRAEKALARKFMGRGIPFFLPLYERRWRGRDRRFQSYVPLFPGYVFLHGDGETRRTALETNLVANVLSVVDQRQLHADLVRVNHLLNSGWPVTQEGQLPPGTPVEIVQGPMAGLKGKVIRQGKNLRFFVEVRFLQQGVSVELESWMIQPIFG